MSTKSYTHNKENTLMRDTYVGLCRLRLNKFMYILCKP